MDIQARIKEISDLLLSLYDEKDKLEAQQREELAQQLLESKQLSKLEWKIANPEDHSDDVKLDLLSSDDGLDVYLPDYHSSFYLRRDVELGRSDNDVYLYGEWDAVFNFIVEQDLKINTKNIDKALKELDKQTKLLFDLKQRVSRK